MRRQNWEGPARSILRIVAGAIFAPHGFQKLFGLFGHAARPPLGSLLWIAGVLEVVGGVLILLGLYTRPTAFVLSGEMAVAYFHAHAPRGFWPIRNGGELAVLFCFIYLYLVVAGPGPISLDKLVRRKE